MWKAIGVSAALLVAILLLSRMQGGRAGLDPQDQLTLERQVQAARQRLAGTPARSSPILACAAGRASATTVRTSYLVWIGRRADLTTVPDRDAAAQDLDHAITACGGDPLAVETAAHAEGLDLGDAASRAMLSAGR